MNELLSPLANGHMFDAEPDLKRIHADAITRWADKVMELIEEDEKHGLLRGVIVRCYEDMHGKIDTNELEIDAGVPWGADAQDDDNDGYEFVRAVQTMVDARLHARGYNAALAAAHRIEDWTNQPTHEPLCTCHS